MMKLGKPWFTSSFLKHPTTPWADPNLRQNNAFSIQPNSSPLYDCYLPLQHLDRFADTILTGFILLCLFDPRHIFFLVSVGQLLEEHLCLWIFSERLLQPCRDGYHALFEIHLH